MLDKKTTCVLAMLGKMSENTAYKVVTIEELLNSLPSKSFDADGVKNTIDFLSKQEYILIKFEEEYTICYSMLPKARIYLETEASKGRVKKPKMPIGWIMLSGVVSGLIASVVSCIFYYLIMK